MSSRPRKARGVARPDSSDSTPKHARSGSGNEEYSQRRSTDREDSDSLLTLDDEESSRDFATVHARELFEFDPRPTFVIHEDFDQDMEPIFINRATRSNDHLMKTIPFKARPGTPQHPSKISSIDFIAWAKEVAEDLGQRTPTILYCGFLWTGFLLRRKWLVISGNQLTQEASRMSLAMRNDATVNPPPRNRVRSHKDLPALQQQQDMTSKHYGSPKDEVVHSFITHGTPDWTIANPKGALSPHTIFARSIDWGTTPLGDMSTWSREFRQICNHLMANPFPAALFWGDELTVMYNKPYADTVAGSKHPGLMGTGFRGPFAELWDLVSSIFNECSETGKSVAVSEQMLPIERHGFLEETFYSWSLTPLYGGTDRVLGLYNAPFETTRQTRSARALRTLLKLGQETALADSVSAFWPQILKALEDNEFDFPFVLLYSVSDDIDDADDGASISNNSVSQSSESSSFTKCCVLEGSLGVPEDHPAAPKRLELSRSRGGFIPSFREAMKTREPKLLNLRDGSVPESLIEGINWRGFGEPSREAVICPIRPTTGENVLGFLFVGINPRRPFDEDYQSFIQLIDRQLATSLASVSLLEAEVRRGLTAAEAAALERSRLSEELAVQRSRLQRIAEISPVGMFSIDPSGMLLEANDRWFEITGHSRNTIYPMSWMEAFSNGAIPIVMNGWDRLTVDKMPWSSELKLKRTSYDVDTGEVLEIWTLAAAQPEFADGELKSIMGSLTDITFQKRASKDAETRAKLSEQLLLRTQEAKENEKNFKRFSDLAPGGLVIMTPEGGIEYANSQWYKISGHPGWDSKTQNHLSWKHAILQDDQEAFNAKWEEMASEKRTVTIESRMQAPWEGEIAGSIIKTQRWVLASVYPEISDDGSLKSVMGCITDISSIKWAEGLQNQRLKEAEETRRQQNNFIDITSHEMRNPLSAILQCADGICTSLTTLMSHSHSLTQELSDAIKESISSSETIQLCAQHQKSIVDDILTISKLDSNLLLITPIPVQPVNVVRQTLQMFLVECQKVNDIKLEFHVEKSFDELSINTVMIDSSRLRQVLINLMTNAIKFTKQSTTRNIDVSISAHLQIPPKQTSDFDYFPTKKARSDVTSSADWGKGEIIYLRFEVKDSGCGLTPDEKKKLFNRFTQASPRTHVQYGGSGLGLFISRQLTELQGGEIGVASESNVGSTFAFYVKARRSETLIIPGPYSHRTTSGLEVDLPKMSKPLEESEVLTLADANPSVDPEPGMMSSNPSDWHVLIVEDNLVNQKILAQQIKKLGSTVHVANHGQEALDLIEKSKAYRGREEDGIELSIILMDLEMPVMDGLTCVRKIREMEAEGLIQGRLPVIAVTANARGEQIAAAKDSGMDDVMSKPFRIRQLVPKIEVLINNTRRN